MTFFSPAGNCQASHTLEMLPYFALTLYLISESVAVHLSRRHLTYPEKFLPFSNADSEVQDKLT